MGACIALTYLDPPSFVGHYFSGTTGAMGMLGVEVSICSPTARFTDLCVYESGFRDLYEEL